VSRSFDLEFFYTDAGILPLSAIADLVSMKYRFSILFYVNSLTGVWILHTLFLVSLLTMAFGIFPRTSAFVALILHLSFLHRNMAIAYGVDSIAVFFLFCLSMSNAQGKRGTLAATLESMGLRLIQFQVCVIYVYAGFEKLKGTLWWKGEAVWYTVANYQIATMDFSWLAHFPILIVLATYSTVLWEVYFPVLIWIQPLKRWVLLYGILLHLGIALTVNIPFFAAIMICTYVLFLNNEELDQILSLSKKFTIKLKSFWELPKRVLSRL
jgi:hypothetical protein